MPIQDYIDQINEETSRINSTVTEHTDLLEQIASALEGKASGSSGITPTGTINITENGTYDVTNYASAEVNVEGSGGGATVHSGTSAPTDDIGSDGDVYLVVSA